MTTSAQDYPRTALSIFEPMCNKRESDNLTGGSPAPAVRRHTSTFDCIRPCFPVQSASRPAAHSQPWSGKGWETFERALPSAADRSSKRKGAAGQPKSAIGHLIMERRELYFPTDRFLVLLAPPGARALRRRAWVPRPESETALLAGGKRS